MTIAKALKKFDIGREVRSITTDILLSDDSPSEHFLIRMKPEFKTACWAYLPPHRIYVGEECLNHARPTLTKDDLRNYLESFIRHELGHLRWTYRDLPHINERLKQVGIPFKLWNLFEDARIEHIERQRTGKKFNWALFEEIPAQPEDAPPNPGLDFFLLVQQENENRDLRMPAVVEFYDRAIAAASSMALIVILEDWVILFGNQTVPERFETELLIGAKLQTDQQFQMDFDKDSTNPGEAKVTPKSPPVPIKKKLKSKLLAKDALFVDFLKAERLADNFLKLFGSRVVTGRSNDPSTRISARHLELERPFYKRKETIQATVKKLCLVIDCSGSMGGPPIEDAKLLAWALSTLAEKNKIQGCLILSAVNDDGDAVNELFSFPVSKEIVSRIHAFGRAEGLNAAILANHKVLAQADMVFVKTDGDICDEPLEQHKVRQMGITVCGLYSGGISSATDMEKHFEKFFARNSLEGLIDALLQSRLS